MSNVIYIHNQADDYIECKVMEDMEYRGSGRLYLIRNQSHDKPYALIEDIIIKEEFRNKGYGKRLVKGMIDTAKEMECYKIISTGRFPRENVHKFYKDLGFEKWGYEFRMDL